MPKHEAALNPAWPETPKKMDSSKSDTLKMEVAKMAETNQSQTGSVPQNTTQTEPQGGVPAIDYDKIQQMLNGTLAAKEDTALKAYFKQQGLSQQEAEQAIAAYKQQKAANTPDVAGLQNQLTESQSAVAAAKAEASTARVEAAASMMAISLGIDVKTVPYVLKMADLSQVTGQDGKISEDALKTAISKVLEDVPALKPQEPGKNGFLQIGTGGNPSQSAQNTETNKLQQNTKRWNRWN